MSQPTSEDRTGALAYALGLAAKGAGPYNLTPNIGRAVLDTPEMLAIKAELRHGWCCDECIAGQMGERGVPQSVTDWVLS